jgi:RNA recognition motif. (a.k.a. RRM, RBD, or RNP domain)
MCNCYDCNSSRSQQLGEPARRRIPLKMPEAELEATTTTSSSNKHSKKMKKEKKRKQESIDEGEPAKVDKVSTLKKDKKKQNFKELYIENGSESDPDSAKAGQVDLDDKEARRLARKKEREERRREKEELKERVPKVDEHGIAYTKLQIKRMLKRVKQGLNPVPTEEEERQLRRNEAQLRREEEVELAGMIYTRDDEGDESKGRDDSENEGESDGEDGDEEQTEGDVSGNEGTEMRPEPMDEQPAKKKTKRSKPVPPDYTCMACNNRQGPAHWIYDCPDKKTMKGINNKKKKDRGVHEPDSRKVFVSGLPFEIKVSDVQQLFDGCGEIASCKLLKFNDTGRCNGQAYVSFTTDEAASKALKLSGTVVDNKVNDSQKKKKPKDESASKRQELKLKVSRVLNRRKTKTNSGGDKN